MKQLDRRRLLTSGAAAAVFAATGLVASAAPRRQGVLRLGLSGATDSDRFAAEFRNGTFMQVATVGCAFETLTEICADGSLKGELATTWEPRQGGRVWTFGLRPDVAFHDGRILRSEDVVFSLRRQSRDTGPLAGARVRKLDARHVEIALEVANPDLPIRLAHPDFIIHPAEGWQNALARGLGTGLYRLDRFEAGSGFVATRVTDHWRGDGVGWFDRVIGKSLPTSEMRLAALLSGDVDAIDISVATCDIPPRSLAEIRLHASGGGFDIAARSDLQRPGPLGRSLACDDARITQRWWFG